MEGGAVEQVRRGMVERLRDEYVRSERVGPAHEVLYFRLLDDTMSLVDRLSQLLRENRPECVPDPVMAVGDVLAVGFELAGAAVWRAALRLDDLVIGA